MECAHLFTTIKITQAVVHVYPPCYCHSITELLAFLYFEPSDIVHRKSLSSLFFSFGCQKCLCVCLCMDISNSAVRVFECLALLFKPLSHSANTYLSFVPVLWWLGCRLFPVCTVHVHTCVWMNCVCSLSLKTRIWFLH